MNAPFVLLVALVAIVPFAIAAKRLRLPSPIVLVLGGALLAFLPGLPRVTIAPGWIFYTVLPPLLFSSGWGAEWRLVRKDLQGITVLAVALVIVSAAATALVVKHAAPDFSWATAFVLGAIVSPPDAVAATAVLERFRVPRRVLAVLDGEGLFNDGIALVLYRFAVVAAVTGSFSIVRVSMAFVYVAALGVLFGIAFAYVIEGTQRFLKRFDLGDTEIDNLILFAAPYVVYLAADTLGISGILATVAAGITAGRRSSLYLSPESRLVASSFWDLWIYLLNALIFLLIGFAVRSIVLSPGFVSQWLPIAALISVVLIVVRFVWVMAQVYIPRLVWPELRRRRPVRLGWVMVIGWTGLRGIISLAAALSLPFQTANGAPFPQRSPIVFITFCVIIITLVGQGLSLIPFLRRLKLKYADDDEQSEEYEIHVRVKALQSGLHRIQSLRQRAKSDRDRLTLDRLEAEYRNRIDHLVHHTEGAEAPEESETQFDHLANQEAIDAERREIMRMRDEGEIPDEIFRRIQYDLDLATARLY
jgi:Na+/H+ antiporter